jgi:ABC-type multidrug transport system ATPase subunit
MTPILEARGLMKRYGKTQALAGLDLVADPGRVVALLGPNGAGKTTFVRTVATLLRPDAGTLHVDGIDALRKPAKVRQVIGLAGQFAAVEEAMTGRENLEMVGRLFGLSKPMTPMIDAVRSLATGAAGRALLEHSTSYYVGLSLIWAAAIAVVFGLLAVLRFARH